MPHDSTPCSQKCAADHVASKATGVSATASPTDPNLGQILQDLQSNTANDESETPRSTKRQCNLVLTPELFEHLLRTHSKALASSPTSTRYTQSYVSNSQPAYYSNAKYKEISSKGIKPLYNGSEQQLIPFLTKLDLRRQHEGWAPATYVTIDNKKHDLTTHFALISETDINLATSARWESQDIEQHKHTIGHDTYNAGLLAMVITNSLTDDFMNTLIHRIPSSLRNDGTYLLWAVSHNIHHNNIAFHEHIRDKIRLATLAAQDNDIDKYIITLKNYLKMITPLSGSTSTETGLLTYILKELKL
jgi:hypothetical protein